MMNNIEIKISKESRMVDISKSIIGNDSENLQGKLIFSFTDNFVDGQARLEYEINKESSWIALEKKENSYEVPIKSVLTKKGQINMQLVISEGSEETDIPIFKSNVFYVYCNSSINAVGEAPDGYDSWLEIANSKLNAVENIDVDLKDGYLTVTQKDGSTKTEYVKGETGDIGPSGVYVGSEEPTDANVWIDPTGDTFGVDGVVLYENTERYTERTTEITLKDNYKNYDYIEIYAKNDDAQYLYGKFIPAYNGNAFVLSCSRYNSTFSTFLVVTCKCRMMTNTNMNILCNGQFKYTMSTGEATVDDSQRITVLKIVGYKLEKGVN